MQLEFSEQRQHASPQRPKPGSRFILLFPLPFFTRYNTGISDLHILCNYITKYVGIQSFYIILYMKIYKNKSSRKFSAALRHYT